jgi:hypothetical protein
MSGVPKRELTVEANTDYRSSRVMLNRETLPGFRSLRADMPGLNRDLVIRSEIYCDRVDVKYGQARYPFADLCAIAAALGEVVEPGNGKGELLVSGWLSSGQGELRALPYRSVSEPLPFTAAQVVIEPEPSEVRLWLRYVDHPVCARHAWTADLFRRVVAAMGHKVKAAA